MDRFDSHEASERRAELPAAFHIVALTVALRAPAQLDQQYHVLKRLAS